MASEMMNFTYFNRGKFGIRVGGGGGHRNRPMQQSPRETMTARPLPNMDGAGLSFLLFCEWAAASQMLLFLLVELRRTPSRGVAG